MTKNRHRSNVSILSLSLIAFVSSAVLPQNAYAQIAQNRSISQRPLNLNQLLRAYGLDKQSDGFSFTSKQIDRNQAVFRGVKFGKDASADTLTLSLSATNQQTQLRVENWILHEKEMVIKMQNAALLDRSREKGIQPKAIDIFGPEKDASIDFFGDLVGEKIEIQSKADTSSPFTFEKISLIGVQTKKDKIRFDSIELSGFSTQVQSFLFSFNSFKIGGLSDAIFEEMNKPDAAKKPAKKNLENALAMWNKIGLEIFHLGGLKVSQATNSTSRPRAGLANSFGGFELASFDIRDFTSKKWGHFGLKGMKASATVSNEDIKFNLDEISFNGLNFDYFKAIYASALSKGAGSEYDNLSLSDIFKGGPLDGGLENATFKGLLIEGMGGQVSLDNASFNSQKNSDGIYTKLFVPRGKFEIKALDDKKPFGKILSEVNDKLGLTSFVASWSGNSDFELSSDRVSSYFDFKIDGFGSVDFRGITDGAASWHKQTKIKDLAKLMAMSMEASAKESPAEDGASESALPAPKEVSPPQASGTKKSETVEVAAPPAATAPNENKGPAVGMRARPPSPTESLRKLAKTYQEVWPLYKGLRLVNASFEIRDLGALNKIAVNEAATKGKTPTQIRQAWREPFGQYIATKSNPALFRQLALGFSSFISKGGNFKISIDPPTPFEISRFGEPNLNTNEIGLKATVSQ